MKKIKCHLRFIERAAVNHKYDVQYFVEYEDGEIVFQCKGVLNISQTNVRRRDVSKGVGDARAWEQLLPGVAGWFRCDSAPKNVKLAA